MGKVTGFMEYERVEEGYAPVPRAREALQGIRRRPQGRAGQGAGARAAWTAACPFCNSGCPVNNIIPDFNDLVYRQDWKHALDGAALDQQLPRVHRPHLPRAVRGGLHAQLQRRPGGHQVDRARDHRPRLGRGLGRSRSRPRIKTGKKVAVVGSGPAGTRGRAAARARRPRRDGVREERPHRRPAALRHPRLQDGEVAHRPPRRADEGRGRHLPHRRDGRRAAQGLEGHQLGQGDDLAPSSCRSEFDAVLLAGGAEQSRDLPVPGRDLDGIHFAMEFLPQQNKVNAGDKVKGQIAAPTASTSS